MIIDSHMHVGDWKYPYYKYINNTIHDIDRVLWQSNMDGAVLIPTDKTGNLPLLKSMKKFRNGKRYWFFFWVNPKSQSSLKQMDSVRRDISGLKFHSGLDLVKGGVAHKAYRPFFEFAEEAGLPALIHCGRSQEYSSYRFAMDVASKYRNVKFIFAHLGGDFEGLKIECPREIRKSGLKNIWLDISATREFWTIEMAAKELGHERIIFGSDFPIMHPDMSIASVNCLGIGKKEKEDIFGFNLLKLLGCADE